MFAACLSAPCRPETCSSNSFCWQCLVLRCLPKIFAGLIKFHELHPPTCGLWASTCSIQPGSPQRRSHYLQSPACAALCCAELCVFLPGEMRMYTDGLAQLRKNSSLLPSITFPLRAWMNTIWVVYYYNISTALSSYDQCVYSDLVLHDRLAVNWSSLIS